MQFVFLVILSFAAYCSGAILGRRRASRLRASGAVHPIEALLVGSVVVAIVLLRRPYYPLVDFVACAVAMLLIGATTGCAGRMTKDRVVAGTREFESIGSIERPTSAWKRWTNFSRAVADYEFRILLVACYLLIIGPFALAFRIARKEPRGAAGSAWVPRSDGATLEAARRPF